MFTIEQNLNPDLSILDRYYGQKHAPNCPRKTPLDELQAQQQLARIVSEVVRELEDGVTHAMLEACRQGR